MNFKNLILNKLLDKYENSKSYSGTTNRRIIVKMSEVKEYDIEDFAQRELCNTILIDLKKSNLIDIKWEDFEEGNILEYVWLIKDNIRNVYKEVGRINPKESYKIIINQIKQKEFSQNWIQTFIEDIKKYMQEKQKESTYLPLDVSNNILVALSEIDKIQENSANPTILKRVFSIRCYNDSKYFERNIEKYIIKILRKYLYLEDLNNDEVLAEVGIVRYPEIIEFCGDIQLVVNGTRVNYYSITEGSYLNGNTILNIQNINIESNIRQIIFIENKANYIDYIKNKKDSELVIYHGGFYSPIKGEFFRKIYNVTYNKNVEFFHWSDIDIGGFSIFTRLRDNIIPDLKPFMMDIQTLSKYINSTNSFDESYRQKLAKLRQDVKYEIFWDVIDFMLEKNVRLEQESIV